MDDEWLVVLSLSVALSFVASAVLNARGSDLYQRFRDRLPERDTSRLHPSDRPIDLGDARAVVLGMGRVGQGAYTRLTQHYGLSTLGIEADADKVASLEQTGVTILEGDATDTDFWDKLVLADTVDLVILAMPHHSGNALALEQLRDRAFTGRIAAVVQHVEEIDLLRKRGADAVFHLYDEAGTSLADSAAEAAGLTAADR